MVGMVKDRRLMLAHAHHPPFDVNVTLNVDVEYNGSSASAGLHNRIEQSRPIKNATFVFPLLGFGAGPTLMGRVSPSLILQEATNETRETR